mgnify:CR=1 FL=1
MDIKKWWKNLSDTDRAVFALSSFCGIALLYLILSGIMLPDITFLSLETYNYQINDKPCELEIRGVTEPNSKVYLKSKSLNLNGVPVNLNKNGSFMYRVKIPAEISDTSVSVISKSRGKYEVNQDIQIQRPLTFLSIKPMQKIHYNKNKITVEGKSEPGAQITILSNMTLRDNLDFQSYMKTALNDPVIKKISLKADSEGNFNYQFLIPSNSTSVYFNVSAKSYGKRSTTQLQNITREFLIFPPLSSIFEREDSSNTVRMNYYKGKGFTISYPEYWDRKSYKDAGKESRFYVKYGQNVEGIVWHTKFGKNFENSIEEYKKTQDIHLRKWWGGNQVYEQKINSNGVKGIRTVYMCQQNPQFSNDISAPFYLDQITLTRDNVNVFELQITASQDYYEKNDYIIEKTVQSFKLN